MMQLSYVHGASDTPFIGETIGVHFDWVVERFADRDALIVRHQEVRWTYRELKERVDAFAAGLLALGLKRGDRIGIWSPNNAEWVIAQFATAKAGLILVNINPAYRLAELEYALNKAGCVALITATQFKTSDYLGDAARIGPRARHRNAGQSARVTAAGSAAGDRHRRRYRPRHGAVRRRFRTRRHAERHGLAALAEELQFDDPINIQFTSGTTGFPKGATLSHHNILNNGLSMSVHRRGYAVDRARSALHSGAALSLLRHGARQSRLPDARRGDGFSERRLRSSRHPRSGRGRALHRRSTACRRCSSPRWTIPTSRNSICPRCAPASWPAALARSRS